MLHSREKRRSELPYEETAQDDTAESLNQGIVSLPGLLSNVAVVAGLKLRATISRGMQKVGFCLFSVLDRNSVGRSFYITVGNDVQRGSCTGVSRLAKDYIVYDGKRCGFGRTYIQEACKIYSTR